MRCRQGHTWLCVFKVALLTHKRTGYEKYNEYSDTETYLENKISGIHTTSLHGPAEVTKSDISDLTIDSVYCVRSLVWPSQAADWPTRHRNYDWPDSATVDRVVSNGCDVVAVAHHKCR